MLLLGTISKMCVLLLRSLYKKTYSIMFPMIVKNKKNLPYVFFDDLYDEIKFLQHLALFEFFIFSEKF